MFLLRLSTIITAVIDQDVITSAENDTFYPAFGCLFFRLDALAKALSVITTATWLGGWVAGWLGVRHTPVLYQNG